jgi:hypothetical protein
MLRGATADQRATVRGRLQRLPRAKATVLNVGIVLVLLAATGLGDVVPAPAAIGWAMVAAAAVVSLAPLLGRAARA